MARAEPRLQVREPRAFGLGALVRVHAYGLFLVVPVLLAAMWLSVSGTSLYALLLPFGALAVTCVFLPFGLGNSCISRLVRRSVNSTSSASERFIVQMTATPRLRTGLRAVLEDADDVGWLSIEGSDLRFEGDSVELKIPREAVAGIRPENIGLRTLFVYGPRLALEVRGFDNLNCVEFAERSSLLLPASRRTSRQMRQTVEKWAGNRAGP